MTRLSTTQVLAMQVTFESARIKLYSSMEMYLDHPSDVMKDYILLDIAQMRSVLDNFEKQVKGE